MVRPRSIYSILHLFAAIALLASTLTPSRASVAVAQADSRLFPETGLTVSGKFLAYWDSHGGLAQQGLPLSASMDEKSDTDGKTYTVQYFERAVFELHPENQPPNDVLLSLLGVFSYKSNYVNGEPSQTASTSPDIMLFPETGKHVGGRFLEYWKTHGGLTQQGFPISEEFIEVSKLNGQSYKVQYFERAVFELHPENQPPNDVLLSQLGTFQYRAKYQTTPTPNPTATPNPATPTLPPPSVTPIPTAAPVGPDCSGIPPAEGVTVTPLCSPAGNRFNVEGSGFTPLEYVKITYILQSGSHYVDMRADADDHGVVTEWHLDVLTTYPTGIWTVTMEGENSHVMKKGYFKVTPAGAPDCSGIPANITATVTPSCATAGALFVVNASGFQPGEQVSRFYVTPIGNRQTGSSEIIGVDSQGRIGPIGFGTSADAEPGIWAAVYEGNRSGHQSVGYFKVLLP